MRTKKIIKEHYIWIIVLLVIFDLMLLYKNYSLEKKYKDLKRQNYLQLNYVPDFVLYDLNGEEYNI